MALKKYISKHAGLFVPLPPELVKKYSMNFIKFKTGSGSIFGTEEKDLQEFIEGVPELDKSGKVVLDRQGLVVYKKQPIKPWKLKIVMPLPTEEELEYAAKQKEFDAKREHIREFMASGIKLPDDSFSDSDVRKYARAIGVQTGDSDGNKLPKSDILVEIHAAFGMEYKKPVEPKQKEKKDEK